MKYSSKNIHFKEFFLINSFKNIHLKNIFLINSFKYIHLKNSFKYILFLNKILKDILNFKFIFFYKMSFLSFINSE